MEMQRVERGRPDPDPVQRGIPAECKRLIVTLFAQFQGLSAVQDAVEEAYGLHLDQRTLAAYDPQRPSCRMGQRLRELYAAQRKAYVEGLSAIAISHQGHRLRVLERLIEKAEKAREYDVAGKLLEQAAKEMGGVLTNVSKVKHEGKVEHRHLSVEDARQELAERLSSMIDMGELTALPRPEENVAQPTDNAGE